MFPQTNSNGLIDNFEAHMQAILELYDIENGSHGVMGNELQLL